MVVGAGGDVPEGGASTTEWRRRTEWEGPEVWCTVTAVTSTGDESPGGERREREVREKELISSCWHSSSWEGI